MLVGRVFNMLSLIRVLYHNHNKSQDLKIGTYIVPLYLIVTSLRLPLSLMKKTVKKMLSDISGTLIREWSLCWSLLNLWLILITS